jgi:hypothetical protein
MVTIAEDLNDLMDAISDRVSRLRSMDPKHELLSLLDKMNTSVGWEAFLARFAGVPSKEFCKTDENMTDLFANYYRAVCRVVGQV